MTKKELILMHLINHGSITSMESFEKYKATRLSGIIFNLKKEGYCIETQAEKGKDCVYARYIYKGKTDFKYEPKQYNKPIEPIIEQVKVRNNEENDYDAKTGNLYLGF